MYVPTKRNDIGVLQQFFSHSHVSSFFHQLEHSDLKVKGNALRAIHKASRNIFWIWQIF